MARVFLNKTLFVKNNNELEQKLENFFQLHKMHIIQKTNNIYIVKQGSQLYTRFFGGWFVSPQWYPKKASINIHKTETNIQLDVLIEETLGFGYLDKKFKAKYLNYFNVWMLQLEEALK